MIKNVLYTMTANLFTGLVINLTKKHNNNYNNIDSIHKLIRTDIFTCISYTTTSQSELRGHSLTVTN